ncbi:MAG: HAMP domain-containing sensor histidine kinase [Microgenomates group bacterium]
MFLEARLKLTAWYLLILMIVSMSFSVVIFHASTFELNRFAAAQRQRFERRMMMIDELDIELINETKHRILLNLLVINLGILGISSVLSYYLSGKTLEPIKEMMDAQYRFISDASHELKTPITAIKTTLEVALRDKNLQINEARDTMGSTLEEANRLQKLAEGLLELTHKNIAFNMVPTNIDEVLSNVKKTLEPIAKSKHIAIVVTKSIKVVAMMDPASMERAMIALVDNAIKYSHSGGKVSLATKVLDNKIVVKVTDNGIGIEQKEMVNVFDRFYRADKSRHTNGYGLGLSIAKEIVEGNNGVIKIESKKDKGTTVSIALPYSAKLQK